MHGFADGFAETAYRGGQGCGNARIVTPLGAPSGNGASGNGMMRRSGIRQPIWTVHVAAPEQGVRGPRIVFLRADALRDARSTGRPVPLRPLLGPDGQSIGVG